MPISLMYTDTQGELITGHDKVPLAKNPDAWSYWATKGGVSLSTFLQKQLSEILSLNSGLWDTRGDRGCPLANPVSVYLLGEVLDWTGPEGSTITIEIPVAQSALCKAINENGVVGHCPVPQTVREWLKRFHAGDFLQFVAHGM